MGSSECCVGEEGFRRITLTNQATNLISKKICHVSAFKYSLTITRPVLLLTSPMGPIVWSRTQGTIGMIKPTVDRKISFMSHSEVPLASRHGHVASIFKDITHQLLIMRNGHITWNRRKNTMTHGHMTGEQRHSSGRANRVGIPSIQLHTILGQLIYIRSRYLAAVIPHIHPTLVVGNK